MGMNHNGKDLSDQINEIFSSGRYKTPEEAFQAVKELKQREQNRSKHPEHDELHNSLSFIYPPEKQQKGSITIKYQESGEIHNSPCLILPTNQTPKDPSKRKFLGDGLKGLAYIAGIAYGSALLQACGPGPSGSGDNGNTPITTRQEFKNLGWDVYDAKTDDLNTLLPDEGLGYATLHDDFKTAYEANTNGVIDIFSDAEKSLIEKMIDGSMDNDEMLGVAVTGTDRAHLTIDTNDSNVGENGRYAVRKQLSANDALTLASISPDYTP